MSLKRALLPLMPDAAMTQYRFRREQFRVLTGRFQNESLSRTNVDIVVERSQARRWLLSTTDTFRVVDPAVLPEPSGPMTTIPRHTEVANADRLLGWQGIGAVVEGNVEEPRWGDRTAGATIEPITIVVRPEVLEEVGGVPEGSAPLPGLLARITDAGHRIGLIPVSTSGIDSARRDPIEGDTVVILAAVPLHDIGGGSRGAQMALELVRHGYHVTYVNMYPSYEAVDLGLRFIHPRLEQIGSSWFDAATFVERCSHSGVVIVEIPDPAFGPALSHLRESGWSVVADLIDDWSDPALGGEWYDPGYEQMLIADADVVIASAPDLIERAIAIGRDDTTLVPNAVNASVFGTDSQERPRDLPQGTVIGYHGSLYGDWIDWGAIVRIADANPDAFVVLIGEARNVPRHLPDNVVLLGLKPQGQLPAYLQGFTIGFVPFAVTTMTHAVSPLKVYEYLASGLPVAAPPLRALDGLSDVYTDHDLVSAVSATMAAPTPDRSRALIEHSWQQRLTTLFAAMGGELGADTGDAVRVVQRPVTHYAWRQRRVR